MQRMKLWKEEQRSVEEGKAWIGVGFGFSELKATHMKAGSLGIYMEKLWQAGDKSYFVERRDERGNPKLDKISSFNLKIMWQKYI